MDKKTINDVFLRGWVKEQPNLVGHETKAYVNLVTDEVVTFVVPYPSKRVKRLVGGDWIEVTGRVVYKYWMHKGRSHNKMNIEATSIHFVKERITEEFGI